MGVSSDFSSNQWSCIIRSKSTWARQLLPAPWGGRNLSCARLLRQSLSFWFTFYQLRHQPSTQTKLFKILTFFFFFLRIFKWSFTIWSKRTFHGMLRLRRGECVQRSLYHPNFYSDFLTTFGLEASNSAGLWKEWVLGKACLPRWLAHAYHLVQPM